MFSNCYYFCSFFQTSNVVSNEDFDSRRTLGPKLALPEEGGQAEVHQPAGNGNAQSRFRTANRSERKRKENRGRQ